MLIMASECISYEVEPEKMITSDLLTKVPQVTEVKSLSVKQSAFISSIVDYSKVFIRIQEIQWDP